MYKGLLALVVVVVAASGNRGGHTMSGIEAGLAGHMQATQGQVHKRGSTHKGAAYAGAEGAATARWKARLHVPEL